MANRTQLPKDPELAGKVLETEHATKLAEMGKIGILLGSRDNAAVYIAGFLILIAVIFGGIIALCEPTLRSDALKAIFGLAATALGFMLAMGTGATKHKD